MSNELAAVALSAQVRPRLLQRTRAYVRGGYALLQDWLKNHGKIFTCRPPDAGPIAFVRYHLDVNSSAFVEGLRRRKSVLIVPGDHFELDHFVRIGFGGPQDRLVAALNLIHEYLLEIGERSPDEGESPRKPCCSK